MARHIWVNESSPKTCLRQKCAPCGKNAHHLAAKMRTNLAATNDAISTFFWQLVISLTAYVGWMGGGGGTVRGVSVVHWPPPRPCFPRYTIHTIPTPSGCVYTRERAFHGGGLAWKWKLLYTIHCKKYLVRCLETRTQDCSAIKDKRHQIQRHGIPIKVPVEVGGLTRAEYWIAARDWRKTLCVIGGFYRWLFNSRAFDHISVSGSFIWSNQKPLPTG
jgi:hypothetical protein